MCSTRLALVLLAWITRAEVRPGAKDPVNSSGGTFSVNVSMYINSVSDLDIKTQKFDMDSTLSQYYYLTETVAREAYEIVRRRVPSSLLNKSKTDGTWVVVPYPNIQDFWIPELLCFQASSLQLQTTIEKPTTLSMRVLGDGLLMKLEQKKRSTFDCSACLKYYPMESCNCRVECMNTIQSVDTFWQGREDSSMGALWYAGPTRLIDNEVAVSACSLNPKHRVEGICIRVTFSPIVSFIVLSTFLPVFLLVLASFGTSFMSVDSITERLVVSSVVFQSVLTLYIQARLNIPPVTHVTIMDIFILASVITVMATIFQTVVVKVLVQRRAFFDICRHGNRAKVQTSQGRAVKRGVLTAFRGAKKPEATASLLGTLLTRSASRVPYPASRFNRNAGRLLLVIYMIFMPLFWCLAVHIAKAPRRSR